MAWNLVSTATERSAADLYEACARADGSAIDEFVRRYQPELAGYARRHGAEDPEGMANLATFDTVRRLASMRNMEEPAVRAYLYRALKGRLIDERRVAVPQVSIDGLGVELTTDGPESPVLDQLEFSEMLELLTPAEREVVSHRFVGGYTSVETAARVGRSPDAVRRLQSNAIARLRLALAVAAFLVAVGAGYWLVSSSPTVRTTEPIGGPTEQQVPDSSRRTSDRSLTTPGPEDAPAPVGDIVGSNPPASPTASSAPRTTTATTTEASTATSIPEPPAGGPSEQGQANAARPDIGRPANVPPVAAGARTPPTPIPSTLVPTTTPATSPPTTGGPTTSAAPTTPPTTTPPTSTPPTTTTPTGPSTTSGDTVETTTTQPADDRPRGQGRGRGRGRAPGNRGPGDRPGPDDPPGRGGGPGRGPGPR